MSARFSGPISVLDLGCGAGRYFHCVRKLSYLVGLDCALGMLQEAKRPFGSVNGAFGLVQGSVYEIEFKPESFDLIYSVGVFGHFCPLASVVLEKAHRFLKPGGLLALDVVEWRRKAETWKTRAARRVQPFSFGPLRRYITLRLGNYWLTEASLRKLLAEHDFRDVEIRRWIQPHSGGRELLCTARK